MTHGSAETPMPDLGEHVERVAEVLCKAAHPEISEAFRMDSYPAHCSECAKQAEALLAAGGVVAGIVAAEINAKLDHFEAGARDVVARTAAEALNRGYQAGAAEVRTRVNTVIEQHGQDHVAGHKWVRDDHLRAALAGPGKADGVSEAL